LTYLLPVSTKTRENERTQDALILATPLFRKFFRFFQVEKEEGWQMIGKGRKVYKKL
jgi:hypothetical protein